MFTTETITEIAHVATASGIEPAALLAVAEIESGGRVFAVVSGRKEPLIRFEGHYFDRRLNGEKQRRARLARISSPTAGKVVNPASQVARWRMLERAAAIDRKAAFESVSWGIGQVMGAHWAWLGFQSVEALVAEARGGAAGQAKLMARYIVKAGLREALAHRDWARFAHGYNGPNYRRNRYHSRLAAAYRRHAGQSASGSAGGTPGLLRRGSHGKAIIDLQHALSAAGYALQADGRFDERTEAALRQFQRDHGLGVDGIAGPRTLSALGDMLSPAARLRKWWAQLRRLLARHLTRGGI
ncbi:MAG: N-acetylmuramidase domain-containing protein [Rhizobiaceae bacterium]